MRKQIFFLTLFSLIVAFSTRLTAQLTPPSDFSNLPPENFFNDVQFVSTSAAASCNNTASNLSPDFVGKYRTLNFWKPATNTPVKTVQVAIHVFTGNNSLTANDIPWINAVIGAMNFDFSNICLPSDPISGVTHIYDSKIRVEVSNRIYFYSGSPYYSSNDSYGMLNYINSIDPDRLNYLSILVPITGSGIQNATLPWPAYPPLLPSVLSLNGNLFAYCPTDNTQNWGWLRVIEHELGHCFDLMHTYDSDACNPSSSEYLPDVFGPVFNSNCYLQGGWSCDPYLTTNTCTNNWMGGWHSSCYLSPLQMGKIHRALSLKTTRRYVKDEYITALPYDIATNEMWDFDIRWYGDIHVKANTTWTIKCKIMMSVGSKIVVERGGKIIVDGGMISSAGGIWKGVEVWGNSTQPQGNVSSGGQGQAYVINGGIIENAEVGVAATRFDATGLPDFQYDGGIIRATSAVFRNNITAVQLWAYHGSIMSNFSYFKNCAFETDANWLNITIYPKNFVDLYEVDRVSFLGCSFKNTAPGNFPAGNQGTGIFSVDAMFRVGDYCPTLICNNPISSTFENLTYGVNGSASMPFLNCNVDNGTFTNCDKGVSLRGIDYCSTTRCEFTISPGGPTTPHFGIYYDNCSGFQVDQNVFNGTGAPGFNVGIVIRDSRDRSNVVYNNVLDNLHVGIEALGDNDGGNWYDGLRLNCNDMTNNLFDIFVTNSTHQNTITTDLGYIQGQLDLSNPSPKQLVRNTYSATCVGANENQFRVTKTSTNQIIHEHHSNSFSLPQCRDGLVIPTQRNYSFNKPQDCPSSFAVVNNQSTLRQLLVTYAADIASQKALIDGNNTAGLLNIINTGSPGQVKTGLLASSPYLSDQVLIAAIQSNLPAGILKDIIVANSPVSAEVALALNSMTIPSGIRNEIDNVQNGISEREKLEIHISQLEFERDILLSERIRLVLNDTTIDNPMDTVINIIKSENIPDQKCKLASAYVTVQDFVKADSLLDAMEVEEPLDNFCTLTRILIELRQAVNGCLALHQDTIKTIALEDIAIQQGEEGCAQAHSLLIKAFASLYPEDVVFPESESALRQASGVNPPVANLDFKAYPNPASEMLQIDYKIPENTLTTHLVIIDVIGREIIRQQLLSDQSSVLIDISLLANGLYIWRVENDIAVLHSDKFSVLK